MFSFVDTHCHLDSDTFDNDIVEVISRYQEAGVRKILNPGVDLETSRKALRLAEQHPEIYCAVGVHPNDAEKWNENTLSELRALAEHPKVVAIGEIGLDYYRDYTPRLTQHKVFQAQLELAAELGLPVIIHCRQASLDVLNMLEDWIKALRRDQSNLANQPGVLHAFEGDFETALRALENDFFLGVGGPLTYRNASERRAVFAALPLDALLLETDAPYLAPHPHRGERNEPAYIPLIAEMLASLHDEPPSKVAEITSRNAARLFAWRLID